MCFKNKRQSETVSYICVIDTNPVQDPTKSWSESDTDGDWLLGEIQNYNVINTVQRHHQFSTDLCINTMSCNKWRKKISIKCDTGADLSVIAKMAFVSYNWLSTYTLLPYRWSHVGIWWMPSPQSRTWVS